MPNSLQELEAERFQILHQLTTSWRSAPRLHLRCRSPLGKNRPFTRQAQRPRTRFDPQIRLTHKVDGKTLAESFPSPATAPRGNRKSMTTIASRN
jgi:hypothetical protein